MLPRRDEYATIARESSAIPSAWLISSATRTSFSEFFVAAFLDQRGNQTHDEFGRGRTVFALGLEAGKQCAPGISFGLSETALPDLHPRLAQHQYVGDVGSFGCRRRVLRVQKFLGDFALTQFRFPIGFLRLFVLSAGFVDDAAGKFDIGLPGLALTGIIFAPTWKSAGARFLNEFKATLQIGFRLGHVAHLQQDHDDVANRTEQKSLGVLLLRGANLLLIDFESLLGIARQQEFQPHKLLHTAQHMRIAGFAPSRECLVGVIDRAVQSSERRARVAALVIELRQRRG